MKGFIFIIMLGGVILGILMNNQNFKPICSDPLLNKNAPKEAQAANQGKVIPEIWKGKVIGDEGRSNIRLTQMQTGIQ